MMSDAEQGANLVDVESALLAERARLVRLCARWSGNPDVAEDLAQETMIEAWRHADTLRDPAALSSWLSGIARNVCLRWMRRHVREAAHRAHLSSGEFGEAADIADLLADETDFEMELERDELALLLDRALAILPPETRDVLIERYVEESSYAEIARRLELSEGAVTARLHRGKLALRRALTTDLRDEASAYGFIGTTRDGWQEMRTWCPFCGRRRLIASFRRHPGEFRVRCPDCEPGSVVNTFAGISDWSPWFHETFEGVISPKPLLNRAMRWGFGFFEAAIASRMGCCPGCKRLMPLQAGMPPEERRIMGADDVGVHFRCEHCDGATNSMSLGGLSLFLPEGRQFWSEQRRIQRLPKRDVEADGRAAIVLSYQSLTNAAQFDTVWARDTYELLRTHQQLG